MPSSTVLATFRGLSYRKESNQQFHGYLPTAGTDQKRSPAMKPTAQGLQISSEQNAPSDSLTSPAAESKRLHRHASSAKSPRGETPASPHCSSGPTLTRRQHIDRSTLCLQFRDPSSPTPARFMPAGTHQLQWGQKNPCCHLQIYRGLLVLFRAGAQQRIWPQSHREKTYYKKVTIIK